MAVKEVQEEKSHDHLYLTSLVFCGTSSIQPVDFEEHFLLSITPAVFLATLPLSHSLSPFLPLCPPLHLAKTSASTLEFLLYQWKALEPQMLVPESVGRADLNLCYFLILFKGKVVQLVFAFSLTGL